jgi:hypothetical protein
VPVVALGAAAAAVAALALALSDVGDDGAPPRGLAPVPRDGEILLAGQASSVYVVKGGARFLVPDEQRAAFGYDPEDVRRISRATLRLIPSVPRDGSLVRPFRSSLVWRVRAGQRRLVRPPAGADVAIIPSTGLRQIPPAPAHRRTQVRMEAPELIQEARRFSLVARVTSRGGQPQGVCVFYRLGFARLLERASVPLRDGGCTASLKVGGVPRARYSVHFVGYPGWRGSAAATPQIPVVPR